MPLIIIVVLGIVPFVLSFVMGNSFTTTNVVTKVEVTEVTTDSITEEIVITGTVASENARILLSPVNGTVDTCNVSVGQAVEEGDVLIAFDLDELETSYKQSELSYLQSKSDYDTTIASNNELKSEAAEAANEVESLEASIEALESAIEKYSDKIETFTASQVALQIEQEQLAVQIEEKQAEIEILTNALSSATDIVEVETEESIEAGVDNQEAITQEAIGAATEELETLQVKWTEVQEELTEVAADITSYTDKLATATEDLSEQSISLATNEAIAESGENALTAQQIEVLEKSQELAELDSLEADELLALGKEGVTAPYNGVISSVTVINGSQVAQGMELITIESNEEVCVELELSTSQYSALSVGDKAEVEINDTIYSGVVSEINQIVTTSMTGESVIGAKVQITNPDENIFLGVSAKTSIITSEQEDVICISSSVINTSVDGDFVYVLENGVVVKKNIEIGISVLDKVEIISGLEVGEQVISDMSVVLTEGMAAEAKAQ